MEEKIVIKNIKTNKSFLQPVKEELKSDIQGPQEELNRFEEINTDSKIKAWLENIYMINFSRKIIACSNYLYRKIVRRFPKIKKKVLYIHNFINTNKTLLFAAFFFVT